MDAQGLIEFLSTGNGRSDRLSILKLLRDETVSQSELADRVGISRSTARSITELDDSLVKHSEAGYYLTGAGATAVYKYSDACKEFDDNVMNSLAQTPNKRLYLQNLRAGPLTRATLASRANMPTRPTVDRITRTFERAGYVTRTRSGEYALTETGENVIETYESVIRTFEQILDKQHGLEWLGVEIESLPATALADARIEITRPSQGFSTVHEVLNFIQSFDTDRVDHVRVISCFSNVEFEKVLVRFVEAGARVDVLSPVDLMRSYLSMSEEHLLWSRRLVEPPNSSWLLHRSQLPCSLILIDDREVVIAPRTPTDPNGAFGVIFSSDSAITAWAAELFDDYAASDSIQAGFWPRVVQMVKAGEYVESLDRVNEEPPSESTEQ